VPGIWRGQQAPILAAAGAQVWVLDASPRQLAQDRFVAERDNLELATVEGDMADLAAFDVASLDLIVNPVSTLFVPELDPVWAECSRILKPTGVLMTGFLNPDEFVFDPDALDKEGRFVVRYPLPYVELDTLDKGQIAERRRDYQMFHFNHTMEAQLGGILRAGFVVTHFFEDHRPESDQNPIRDFMPSYFVVRAERR
jgi:SAM-dependent methyltransferase